MHEQSLPQTTNRDSSNFIPTICVSKRVRQKVICVNSLFQGRYLKVAGGGKRRTRERPASCHDDDACRIITINDWMMMMSTVMVCAVNLLQQRRDDDDDDDDALVLSLYFRTYRCAVRSINRNNSED